jgi:hypothetical protein
VDIRVTALRAARLIKMDMIPIATQLLSDPHPFIARELCLAMNYEPTEKALDLIVALVDKVAPPAAETPAPAADKTYHPDSELERWRQAKYLPKWYLEAVGIAATNREKEVLEAWQKNGKNKDPKVAEFVAWRLNRVMPEAPKKDGK